MKPTSPPTVRAALYARGVNAPSTDAQFADCLELVTRLDWRVVGVYIDHDNDSASHTRYHYRALLDDIRAGKIDRVVINAPDRLHREPGDAEEYLDLCAESIVDTWVSDGAEPYRLDPLALRLKAEAARKAGSTTAFLRNLHQPCPLPQGARVEIIATMDDPNPLPIGIRGTVLGGNGSQLWVRWDNGSGLALLVDQDPYRLVTALNVDDTSRCPLAQTCDSCGSSSSLDRLEVATISTDIGVYCLTICATCVAANRLPALDYPTAADLICQHCEHLRCDLDGMADALAGGAQ